MVDSLSHLTSGNIASCTSPDGEPVCRQSYVRQFLLRRLLDHSNQNLNLFAKLLDESFKPERGFNSWFELQTAANQTYIKQIIGTKLFDDLKNALLHSDAEAFLNHLRQSANAAMEQDDADRAQFLYALVLDYAPLVGKFKVYQQWIDEDMHFWHGNSGVAASVKLAAIKFNKSDTWANIGIITIGGLAGRYVGNVASLRMGTFGSLLGLATEIPLVSAGQATWFASNSYSTNVSWLDYFYEMLPRNTLQFSLFRGADFAGKQLLAATRQPFVGAINVTRAVPALSTFAALFISHKVEQKLAWVPEKSLGLTLVDTAISWVEMVGAGTLADVVLPNSIKLQFARQQWAIDLMEKGARTVLGAKNWADNLAEQLARPSLMVLVDGKTPEGSEVTSPSAGLARTIEPGKRSWSVEELRKLTSPMNELAPNVKEKLFELHQVIDTAINQFKTADSSTYQALHYELYQKYAEIKEVIDSLMGDGSAMSTLMRHDFNNHATGFWGYLGLFARSQQLTAAPAFKFFDDIKYCGAMMSELAALASGRELPIQTFAWQDLGNWIFRYTKQQNLQVDFSVAESSASFTGNLGLMALVLRNLFENSTKYQDPTRPLHVKLHVENNKLTYQDNASGIGAAYLPDLLSFGNRAGRTDSNGSGAGTHFIAKAVAQHNGTISVESTVGVGTKYVITLP